MNDPRNEMIIKNLRLTKNEFIKNLLERDSRNLLADEEPFRHKLLKARNKNLDLTNVFIPWLESEIIDKNLSDFFLKHLENLYRDEAYNHHLARSAATKGNQGQ